MGARRLVSAAASMAFVAVLAGACSGQTAGTVSAPVAPDGTNAFRTGRTLVIAHAGGDGLFPANTMLAYEHSTEMGSEVIDVDLRLSADGVVVAHHDADVGVQTNGHGAIASMSYAEISRLDAGWGFTRDGGHPYRGQGVRIPTLREILDGFPDLLVSLDMKDEGLAMIEPVCTVLHDAGRLQRVFVGSNSDEQVFEFRARCPDVPTSATLPDARALWAAAEASDDGFVPAVAVDQPPFRIGDRVLVDPARLDFAHRHGVAVLTWVIDDEPTMRELVAMGVDGIYTRRPDLLARVVAEAQPA